ncbi:MAG: glycosyltransferase [Synergistota bacterium]|nr:glycosyltransferase [Synergistota bacterium]
MSQNRAIPIMFLSTGLNVGGAEIMLYRLLSRMNRDRFAPEVVSLMDKGAIGEKIEILGIPVKPLGMKRGRFDMASFLYLVRHMRKAHPRVLQTWMYHANFVGSLASKLAGNISVVWGIHHSTFTQEVNKKSTIWVAKACVPLSKRIPAKIICCSEASKRIHADLGYDSKKIVVIPNGVDVSAFKPDAEARSSVRKELGIAPDAPLIGFVARFDPQKDHENFFKAAKALLEKKPGVYFALCGEGVTPQNDMLSNWLKEMGITRSVFLLGRRDDIPRLAASFDVATLTSNSGEAFPNVLVEAMACGVLCVATDIGDSAYIIGDTGFIVPPKEPEALAYSWLKVLEMPHEERRVLGEKARERVATNFDISIVAAKYEALYEEIATQRA